MNSEITSWRDMYKDNPDYFGIGVNLKAYPSPVTVPMNLRSGNGRAAGASNAYHLACTYVLQHPRQPGIRLVHGSIDPEGDGTRIDQAWAEMDDNLAFDPLTQQFYPTDAFHESLGAEIDRTFSVAQAARLVLTSGAHGPWSETEIHAALPGQL